MPILLSLGGMLASGCESYERPRRPLPEDFSMQVLGGGRLDVARVSSARELLEPAR